MVKIKFIVGDITNSNCEIIVNPANKTLLGGGGVDGAIHRSAGPKLLEECKVLRKTKFPKGLSTGKVVFTNSYNLKSKGIIHTVGPINGLDDISLLKNCYLNALLLADTLNYKSIAFPAISTGAFRVPVEISANFAKEVIDNINLKNIKEINFILSNDNIKTIFENLFNIKN